MLNVKTPEEVLPQILFRLKPELLPVLYGIEHKDRRADVEQDGKDSFDEIQEESPCREFPDLIRLGVQRLHLVREPGRHLVDDGTADGHHRIFVICNGTLGFALLGALIFTLTLVPVMSSMLLKKNVREKNNRFVHFINQKCTALFDTFYAHRKLTIGLATVVAGVGLWLFSFLGTEFLPQLNEGSIYIRATLPQSISLDESVTLANKMRKKLLTFPEVRQVLSQTGRPNDGTDATGFYNIEFHVDIYPEKDWESKLFLMSVRKWASKGYGMLFNWH